MTENTVEQFRQGKKDVFKILFLRGRREASCIEIIDYVFANDPSDAVDKALALAEKYHWHVERVERLIEKIEKKE
jgi:hypothetical protein